MVSPWGCLFVAFGSQLADGCFSWRRILVCDCHASADTSQYKKISSSGATFRSLLTDETNFVGSGPAVGHDDAGPCRVCGNHHESQSWCGATQSGGQFRRTGHDWRSGSAGSGFAWSGRLTRSGTRCSRRRRCLGGRWRQSAHRSGSTRSGWRGGSRRSADWPRWPWYADWTRWSSDWTRWTRWTRHAGCTRYASGNRLF